MSTGRPVQRTRSRVFLHAEVMGKHLAATDETSRPPLWRTKVAVSAVLMLLVVILTIYGFRWLISDQPATPEPTVVVNGDDNAPAEPADEPEPIAEPSATQAAIVHVAGEVAQPGIVELESGGRVMDAIERAGGPTEDAQLDALNLAAIVNDGEYILVPDQDTAEVPGVVGPQTSNSGPAPGGDNAPVNLNTADAAALETLPGVGPATAEQIIAHRDQHGPFTQLADLETVSGIGPATRERLDGLVSW